MVKSHTCGHEQVNTETVSPVTLAIPIIGTARRHAIGLGHAVWASAGNIAIQLCTLITSITVARVLGKVAFGEYSIIQNTVGTMAMLAGGALGLTATRHIAENRLHPDTASLTARTLLRWSIWLSIVLAIPLFLFAAPISSRLFSAPRLVSALMVGTAAVIFATYNGVQHGILSGYRDFRAAAASNAIRALAILLLSTLGANLAGVTGAVAGGAIAYTVGCLGSVDLRQTLTSEIQLFL